MFLSKEEIITLTGYKFRNMQIRWLAEHGYKFDITASGNPVVLLAHITERLGGISQRHNKHSQPDFSNSTMFG